jgi:hypothetical protein
VAPITRGTTKGSIANISFVKAGISERIEKGNLAIEQIAINESYAELIGQIQAVRH